MDRSPLMSNDEILPEHESIEVFAQFLLDEERTSFTWNEADTISKGLGVIPSVVINGLKGFGFTYEGRPIPKHVRGFTSNSHDRWQVCRSHGGSGWEQITGFAGQKG